MQHLAILSGGRFEDRPFHIECSCGPAGDFETEDAARSWMQRAHFDRLTGLFKTDMISFLPDPNVVPEEAPLPDFVDQFHEALADHFSSATPTTSVPASDSRPEPGAEVKSGDA